MEQKGGTVFDGGEEGPGLTSKVYWKSAEKVDARDGIELVKEGIRKKKEKKNFGGKGKKFRLEKNKP